MALLANMHATRMTIPFISFFMMLSPCGGNVDIAPQDGAA
jgi:hypothetical protein